MEHSKGNTLEDFKGKFLEDSKGKFLEDSKGKFLEDTKGKFLEDTICAGGPVNMTKLDGLQLDVADYEKLLRAKMHKNLR